MPVNRADHSWLAYDDLSDGPIQNIANQLGNIPTPGATASAKTYRTVAASAGIANTETLLLAVPLLLPTRTDFGQVLPGTLNAGTLIRWTMQGTCTDTAANTTTFTIRMGTAGTVAGDTSVATFVTSASGTTGTAVPFVAVINLQILTVGTGSNGTGTGQLVINSPATGIIGAAISFNVGSAATINGLTCPTATFIDISSVSAASTTTNTYQSTICEIFP